MSQGYKVVTRKLADGTIKKYYYDRATGQPVDPDKPAPKQRQAVVKAPPPRAPKPELPKLPASAEPVTSARLFNAPPNTMGWLMKEYWHQPSTKRLTADARLIYERAMLHFAPLKNIPVEQVKRRHIAKMYGDLTDRIGMANQFLTFARVLFSFAIERDLIEFNPASHIRRVKGGHWDAWAEEDIETWMAAVDRHPPMVHLGFLIALHTGMRQGDIVSLRWSQYDGQAIRYTPNKTKKKVGRVLRVPVTPELKEALDEAKRTANGLTIISKSTGEPMTTRNFRMQIMNAALRVGCKAAPVHGLRKSAAIRLAQAGASTHEIMSITGHSSMGMVELYTQAVSQEQLAERAIARLRAK